MSGKPDPTGDADPEVMKRLVQWLFMVLAGIGMILVVLLVTDPRG